MTVQKVNKADFQQWLSSPVTQALFQSLQAVKSRTDSLSNLDSTLDQQATMTAIYKRRGILEGIQLVLNTDGLKNAICLKEGEKNEKITDALKFYAKSGCDHFLHLFSKSEGHRSLKQMGRMVRQMRRMNHVAEVMSKGISEDPDEGKTVNIPDELAVS